VETYFNTVDPIPSVAGLHACVGAILALPPRLVDDLSWFEDFAKTIPDLPTEEWKGTSAFAPARIHDGVRHNVESPELYTVFPFRLVGCDHGDRERMLATWRKCKEASGAFRSFVIGETPGAAGYSGWQYWGMTAALLGLADEAKDILEHNAGLTNPGCRFPAMWGPIYDAVPDSDHGANILTTLQLMAFQVEGDRITVLPAWPREWDVSFRFHAPGGTTVDVEYLGGKITRLEVEPKVRMKDVAVRSGFGAELRAT
jgi:hypothetical protein